MRRRAIVDQVQNLSLLEEDSDFFSDGIEEKAVKRKEESSYPCVLLPTDCLEEYQDDNFEKITGRPQPFLPYSEEDIQRKVKNIKSLPAATVIAPQSFAVEKKSRPSSVRTLTTSKQPLLCWTQIFAKEGTYPIANGPMPIG